VKNIRSIVVMLKLTVAVLTMTLAAAGVLGQSPTAPTLRIQADDPNLPADLYYGNIKVKPLRLRPGTNQVISINDSDFFVSEHYVDFLSRFPDQGGMDYWTSIITSCGADANCLLNHRVNVSAAFFIELEFQATGSYVYRFYQGSLGRHPLYNEFVADRRLVVGGQNLEQSKVQFADNWTQRPAFLAKYPSSLSAGDFVDSVLATIKTADGVDLSGKRSTYVSDLSSKTRGAVVREMIDDQLFINAEYNPSFVLMQYFGYLRREADVGGYNFWLNVLSNREPGNFRGMVCSFITSTEFQVRFDAAATHSNSECSNLH
jgi:hypothetical protein